MKIFLLFIFSLIFLIFEIRCKNITISKQPKLSCNEVTGDDSVEPFNVDFYLSTCNEDEENTYMWDLLSDDEESQEMETGKGLKKYLKNCNFKPNLSTVFLVHGFQRDHDEDWIQDIKNILVKNKSTNVILVDWNDAFTGEGGYNYRAAALSTEKVAIRISNLIQKIANIYQIPWRNMPTLHLIGHSLGAHVVGQAARILKAKTGFTVHRVTGLDPAHPCFETDATIRLRKSDAQFVDVIHSNSAPGKNPNFGSYDQLGHVDFYLNGGNHQPGCLKDEFDMSSLLNIMDTFVNKFLLRTAFEKGLIYKIENVSKKVLKINATDLIMNFFESDYDVVCDHYKATVYFVRSFNPNKKYYAVSVNALPITVSNQLISETQDCIRANKCIEMGINAIKYNQARGAYYVNTRKNKN